MSAAAAASTTTSAPGSKKQQVSQDRVIKQEVDEDREKPLELTKYTSPLPREQLQRRESYRKILKHLGGQTSEDMISAHIVMNYNDFEKDRGDVATGSDSSNSGDDNSNNSEQQTHCSSTSTIVTSTTSADTVNHFQTNGADSTSGSVNSFNAAMTNGTLTHLQQHPTRATGSSIIQYSTESQPFFLPFSQSGQVGLAGHQALATHALPHFNTPTGATGLVAPGPHNGLQPGSPGSHQGAEGGGDGTKKRELRLQKNREAARECRRKKKEYIKCLENRVAVLENQNKALIEELKSLKELYAGKQMVHR